MVPDDACFHFAITTQSGLRFHDHRRECVWLAHALPRHRKHKVGVRRALPGQLLAPYVDERTYAFENDKKKGLKVPVNNLGKPWPASAFSPVGLVQAILLANPSHS